ncbi:FG-GAP-like repeat-containing protein, partial [Archangium sp.]|uniref:FG-GAP-like repeat-containing protein n=1 Tax=Archangium sp. TaxID=1872627 RepID=UPI003899959C
PITSWSVTRQPGNVTMTQATGPFEFTGLTNGTSYTFTAVATNANGAGPVSDASQPISPAGTPSAPTNVVATAGDTEVTVTWTASASTGGVPLTGYTVTASPGSAVKVTQSTSVKYTRLPNGVTYTFSVVANNAVSSSPAATSNPATPTMVVCSGTPIFGAQPLIPAGGNVQFLLARDFDADGKVDIVASLTSKKFAILKGLGGGKFGAPALYDATDGLLYLEAVDFNGDGKLDLASHSTLWPGNGDGTFQTDYPFGLPSLTGGTGVAFGDFNGDGKLDSVSVNNNYGPEQIYIGLGNGAGVFTKAYTTRAHPTSNVYPISVVAADFNGDGKLDVATANNTFYDSNVSVLFGNGDGTLGAPAFVQVNGFQSTDLYSQQVIAADYDKDGDIDLIVASPNQGGATPSADGRVTVLINPGNGVFARSNGTSTGPGTSTVAFADFDGNGTKEIVSAAYTDGTIALQPRGLEQQRFPAGAVRAVAAADVDGDGKLDLLGGGADGIAILRGRGDGTFLAPVQYATGPWPQGATIGQMDGDGYPDVIVFDQDRQSTTNLLVSVMRNDPAQGNFYRSTVNIFYPAPGNAYLHNDYPRGGAFGDFNGDGTTDLVLYTRSDTSSWNFEKFFYSVAGQPGSYRALSDGRTMYQQSSGSPYGLVTGNFDGLGNVDLLATQSGTFAFINSGAGTGSYFYGTETNVGSTGPVIAADVNGDGRQDVIAPLTIANTVSVHLMGGTGSTPNGTLGTATTYPAGTTPYEVVAGDFNGDGKVDLVTMNSGSIANFLAGDGLGAFAAPVSFATGGSSGMAAGDFDQDGDLDLAFANATTSSIALVRGNGAASFSAPIVYPAGKNPMGLLAADVNRDGRLDLITVANQASGSMRVFQNNGCVAP